jgi:hypothetical protein
MKTKLNPVYIIIALFLFKVGIIDNLRFHASNDASERRVASVDLTRKSIR